MSGRGAADTSLFTVVEDNRRHYRKYDTDARLVTLQFRKINDNEDIGRYLREMFSCLLEYLPQQNVSPQDRIGLTISNSSRPDQRSIGISLRRADQLDADVILQTIEKVMQSNEQFFMDGQLIVRYIHIKLPAGEGRKSTDLISNFHDFCLKKQSILVIQNRDKLCLARALVTARAFVHKDETPQKLKFYNSIRHSRLSRVDCQKREAEKLCREAGVNLTQGGGIDELHKFQNYLREYKITVFTDRIGKKVMFEGPDVDMPNYIDLIFGENHFNVILNIEAAFNTKNYCRKCRVRFDHLHHHRCETKCVMCNHTPLCEDVAGIFKKCNGCNRVFKNEDCFNKHKVAMYEKNKSTCDAVKRCDQCNVLHNTLKRRDPHKCGEAYCSICQAHKPSWHLCFMKKHVTKNDATKMKFMYVFFDFECTQDSPADRPGYTIHKPNLCVAEQMCYECIGQVDMSIPCGTCGVRQHVFEGDETLDDFMRYVVQPRTDFKKIVMVAHNMKSYDGQFILNHMLTKLNWTPEVITTGTKIQVIKYANVSIVDSLNFLSSKLSDLPSMFDLRCDSKGYFPHFFNRRENWNYVGALPPPEDYGFETMKEKERRTFMEWYEEEMLTNNRFNFREELLKYCKQDVTILRLACLKFRSIFLEQNEIDPFLESITIASACMLTFRKKFLKPNTIGILPVGGYRLADRQSAVALQWLNWIEKSQDIALKHAGNSRELKICGYKVDGYHETPDKSVKTVYEFNGCWYHGCPDCFKKRDSPIVNSSHETMALRYENTTRKKEVLERNGYRVVSMWECTFNNMKANNTELRRIVDSTHHDEPLNPREAFFGGRTNATKLYYEVKEGEKIRYLDVCSLYPWACKYGKFPVGHPKILVGINVQRLLMA